MNNNDNVIRKDIVKYDAYVKKILAHKSILAYILSSCVKEFNNMKIIDIISCIKDDVCVSNINVDSCIKGLNTEDNDINEGLVRYDIVFYVCLKDSLSKIIINIEAQKDKPNKYKILNRAIYYVSRLISSQKHKDFVKSNYDDIKQVYSIWLCMNTKYNSFTHYHLIKEDKLKPYDWKGNIDLINVVLVGISSDKINDDDNNSSMHHLLKTLLSGTLNTADKLAIIEKDYNDIKVDDTFRKDVNDMCNLGEGLVERTIEETTEKVSKEAIKEKRKAVREATRKAIKKAYKENTETFILNMYKKGYAYNQISDIVEYDVDEVKTIIEKMTLTA